MSILSFNLFTDTLNPGDLYVDTVLPYQLDINWKAVTADGLSQYVLAAYSDLGIIVRSTIVSGAESDLSWVISTLGSTTGPFIEPGKQYTITLNARDANGNDLAVDTLEQYTRK